MRYRPTFSRFPGSSPRALQFEALQPRYLLAFDPTGQEQELMQLTNRFRTDPRGEFARLIATVNPRKAIDSNVDAALTFFNTNVSIVQSEMAALNPVPPVGWDETAQRMAKDYLPFMVAAKESTHALDGTIQQRFNRYGFDVSQGASVRENLFIAGANPVHTHASYVIDWGNGPNGIQPARGHRANLINPNVKFAGMAFQNVPTQPGVMGPLVNAQELIGLGVTAPMITGAVFEDKNSNGWYEAGEGRGGVQIQFVGAPGTFTIQTMTAGGYNAKIPAGTYTATASGGGLRFPITIANVVLSSQNVWLNFIYNPATVPPDAFESNNTLSTATVLTGNDQTLTGGTIHAGDIDYFRLPATTTGTLKVDLQFTHAQGNLDLRLLDSSGATLARSATTANLETLSFSIVSGRNYYIVVESATSGGTGGPYSLIVDVPAAQAPVGRSDSASVASGSGIRTLDVLANDFDPDGLLSAATLRIGTAGRGATQIATVGGKQVINYTPAAGFSGVDRFTYIITDSQGLTSAPTSVEVMVVDFNQARPFHNSSAPLDVSGDGTISAIDALFVINQINVRSGGLPTSASQLGTLFGFVDTNGNGTLEPLDALLVINRLNGGSATAEGEHAELSQHSNTQHSNTQHSNTQHSNTQHSAAVDLFWSQWSQPEWSQLEWPGQGWGVRRGRAVR